MAAGRKDPLDRIQVGPNSWMTRRAYEKANDSSIEKLLSIQIGPSCTPSKRSSAPPKTPDNTWEKGELSEDRRSGTMPILNSDLSPVSIKELPQKRAAIDEMRRQRHIRST